MKRKVFLPHVPTRYDPLSGNRVPVIDLKPAADFGELVSMVADGPTPSPETIDNFINQVCSSIESMEPHDYIVATGDPVLISAAIHYAAKKFDFVNVLRWDRQSHTYRLMEIAL